MESIKPLMDLAVGFGSSAPVVGLLLFLWYRADTERRFWQEKVLDVTSQGIEAEKDMTQALNLLTGKLTK